MTEIIPTSANATENLPAPNPDSLASNATELSAPSLPPVTRIQNVTTGSLFGAQPVRPAVVPLSRADWKVYSYEQLEQRVSESHSGEFVIEGLLPKVSLGLLIGDSGIGKSPLLYQASICVAAGIPFLGFATRQGDVLYCDFENGIADVSEMARRLSSHLGLTTVPPNLHLWNFNDCSERYGQAGYTLRDMILGIKPVLVVVDSLTAFSPLIEEKNTIATRALQDLREIARDSGAAILCVHHLRKPSTRSEEAPSSLEDGNLQDWFMQTRGPRALINGVDIRLGVDVPKYTITQRNVETREEIALVMRGFRRLRGEIAPVYIARVLDDEGEALGYRQMVGAELLFKPEQQATFARLGEVFSFGEAKRTYGRRDQATSDFLKKAERIGLIRKVGRGRFEKIPHAPERAECVANPLNPQGLVDGGTPEAERSAAE
jgi:hypothetical protein